MSGHSKWSTIKRKKEKTDAQKGKVFTKIGREIAVAVKEGGPDPDNNARLRDMIAKAKANNMPNENITRSIKKASGDMDGVSYEEIVYEGYGPKGVAVIVNALTDNRNRTAGDMRHFFDKFGGNLGTSGCVSFLFDNKGIIIIEKTDAINEDDLMMDALDSGAEDFAAEDDFFEITTLPEDVSKVRNALEQKGYQVESAAEEMIPQTMVELTDETDITMMEKLIDHLEDHDDVQEVFHNWKIDE